MHPPRTADAFNLLQEKPTSALHKVLADHYLIVSSFDCAHHKPRNRGVLAIGFTRRDLHGRKEEVLNGRRSRVRFKVALASRESWREAKKLLEDRVTIFVENERRLYFSISNPPAEVIEELTSLGATITPDYQYDLE